MLPTPLLETLGTTSTSQYFIHAIVWKVWVHAILGKLEELELHRLLLYSYVLCCVRQPDVAVTLFQPHDWFGIFFLLCDFKNINFT